MRQKDVTPLPMPSRTLLVLVTEAMADSKLLAESKFSGEPDADLCTAAGVIWRTLQECTFKTMGPVWRRFEGVAKTWGTTVWRLLEILLMLKRNTRPVLAEEAAGMSEEAI